ncbi:MAG: hypothetical protein MUF64_23415 [Polyangiaceae bacterium]|jgi:hypothetical protein|nr:hypothetical protein [Polyangiaceae bacterium]
MKADEFRKLTAARVDKARGRLEKHISKKNLDADKARTVRAKFENGVARLNKKVDQVSEDGVVNKDEAKEVRDVARKMKEHRKGQGKQGKK